MWMKNGLKSMPTDEGWQDRCRAMEERMLDGFSPEERERFAEYLGRAYRNLKSERGEGT